MKKVDNLIGSKINNLFVIRETVCKEIGKHKRKVRYFLCLCFCGKKTIRNSNDLISGRAKSCGCISTKQNLIGEKFGYLEVVKETKINNKKSWECVCECGNVVFATTQLLKSGKKSNCGCKTKELLSKVNKTHGYTGTKPYISLKNAKARCENPNNTHYKSYGGRGIKYLLTKEQEIEFMEQYEEGKTIDRIDVNGNYEIGNIRWATTKEQALNTRRNVFITYRNKTQTLKEWCDELKLNYQTIKIRIRVLGWDPERAFNEEAKIGNNQYSKKQ